ncbi:MAG: hypothetical protein L0215_18160 [Gemmataceae bacterium]|nr:hypothetical protein [Gemmataceae bacterium]
MPVTIGNWLVAVSAVGASSQSIQLQQELRNLRAYYEFPATSIRDRRRERFNRLARQWREDTLWLSSTTEIAMHPAYQAIIGMGTDALPLILEDLRTNSGHWYWALKAISNEDPVPPTDRGVIRKMKAAWLKWGQQKGISANDVP